MLDICVVTGDRESEVHAVAKRLGLEGHRVTVLVTDDGNSLTRGDSAEPDPDAGGIRVVRCPAASHQVAGRPTVTRAYRAWRWCKARPFDAICFAERGGAGYFIALARRLGLDFHGTALFACCEGPTLYRLAGNGRLPIVEDLAADHMERASVAWADVAVCSMRALFEWMKDEAWSLPGATVVVPRAPRSARALTTTTTTASDAGHDLQPIRELVFVGSLERRSGLVTFVHAIRRFPIHALENLRVTFLGATPPDVHAWRPGAWLQAVMPPGVTWRMAEDSEVARRYDYLASPSRLAVVPGATEQLPDLVTECLARGLRFVACDTAETRGLVRADDHARVLCVSDPPTVGAALAAALSSGVRPARAADRTRSAEHTWSRLVADAVAQRACAGHTPGLAPPTAAPEVTVVLTHRNRPHLLEQALDGLRHQTFDDFEVVLVDDGSDTRAALDSLNALAPEFAKRGWRVIRQNNRYLGAARNCGWRAARGRLVLFHDDDNVATPRQIERLVAAARYSGAAILTSAFAIFEGPDPPKMDTYTQPVTVVPFLGGALALGLFENCFGDAQALVRRDVLEALGGFREDFGVGHEDWELFARAALAGHEVLALPEPLFWYRMQPDSMLRIRPDLEPDLRRSARAYTELLPPVLRPILQAALGFATRTDVAGADEHRRRVEVEALLEGDLARGLEIGPRGQV